MNGPGRRVAKRRNHTLTKSSVFGLNSTSASSGYIGRAQTVCPSDFRLALVAPGASTLRFISTQSSKNWGSQCGDLTMVEWNSAGSRPLAKNNARSTSITARLVTTTVRLPEVRTAVGPVS